MTGDKQDSYRVVANEDGFQVVDDANRIIMQCRDQTSAHHYADMLNAAFRVGFRAGYSAGKASVRGER